MEKTIMKKEDIDLIKSVVLSNADKVTDEEFNLFLYLANEYGLDPMRKQIWLVKFGNKAQMYAGRDGFLAIAHRSGQFDGMSTKTEVLPVPIKIGYFKSGKQYYMERSFMYQATCLVHRKDMRHPFQVTVTEDEYSTGRDLWANKPKTMLTKVSESQCLRKSFDISGLYAPEEMNNDIQDVKREKIVNESSTDSKLSKLPEIDKIRAFIKDETDINYVRELAIEKSFDGKKILSHLEGRNEIEEN